ncbi:MAG TPA: DUF1761 domain-containing protein [Candidatus Acidoferrales bacterium]|nr:DUF1761 domain-containing protein [Candidatus Acidoferrales bacterium]
MPSKSINHLAAWIGAIAFFIWGYLWHGVFFKAQTDAMMVTNTPPGPEQYIVGFLMSLVVGYGIAIALSKSDTPTVASGISFGIFMGIVFYCTVTLTATLFLNRPISFWLIQAGYALSGFAIVGAIVGGWARRA